MGPSSLIRLCDHLRLVGGDPLDELAGDLVDLAGLGRVAHLERPHRDASFDQLFLEHVDGGQAAFLGGRGDGDAFFTGPDDARLRATEIEALAQFLGGLIQRVVRLLPVDLAHDVE